MSKQMLANFNLPTILILDDDSGFLSDHPPQHVLSFYLSVRYLLLKNGSVRVELGFEFLYKFVLLFIFFVEVHGDSYLHAGIGFEEELPGEYEHLYHIALDVAADMKKVHAPHVLLVFILVGES